MIRVVGIGGAPATGKSELVQAIIGSLRPGRPFARGSIVGTSHVRWNGPGRVRVLGVYDGRPYPGTDRISMAAPPKLLGCLRSWAEESTDDVVVFEGQRFFNSTLVRAIAELYPASRFFLLCVPEPTRSARRSARRDTKRPTFLKAAATQADNAIRAAGSAGETMANETIGDLERNVGFLTELISFEPSR